MVGDGRRWKTSRTKTGQTLAEVGRSVYKAIEIGEAKRKSQLKPLIEMGSGVLIIPHLSGS